MVGMLAFTMNGTTVCAASDIGNAVAGIEIMVNDEALSRNEKQMIPTFPQVGIVQSRSIFDLSEKNATVNWNVKAESFSQSRDAFKTNSTMIEVKLKSDIKSSVTVILLDSAGTELEEKTATLSTITNTKFNFGNLTSAKTYKVKVKNNGQSDINISGTITQ